MSEDLYQVLGVPRGADAGQIRKAWLGLARTHHPDKGGDEAQFKKIQRAFDVLSDEKKRQVYDLTGQIPGEDSGGGGGNGMGGGVFGGMPGGFAFDIGNLFGMFGPHMGGGGGPRRKRPGAPPPKIERIGVSLSQFFNGDSLQINLDRMKMCSSCNGDGAKKKESCVLCKGAGVHTQVINMNGMTMHSQGPCNACIGKGHKIIEVCELCKGNCKISEKKTLEAKLQPGMQSGETLVFQEACSEVPEFEKAGDLHIIFEQVHLQGWQRSGSKGQNLEAAVTITLAESLIGCTVRLDGHPSYTDGLFIQIPAASFTGDVYCITGLGMPLRGETGMYGDLYVKVNVNVKLTERRILASDAGQEGVKSLFAPLCRTPEGYEEGKTEVQKDLFLSRV